jgi:hypothetical protein
MLKVMTRRSFEYCVWLRDAHRPPDDEDHEWPAVFVVRAADERAAQTWGDWLAHDYCRRVPEASFISSSVEPAKASTLQQVPIIEDGERASDNKLGW